MSRRVDALRLIPRATLKTAVALAAAVTLPLAVGAEAGDAQEQVHGYFCNAKKEAVAFLSLQAQGENEIMAAEAVNKSTAKFTCAPYIKASAIPTGEHTVIEDGLVFKVQSYLFLPEKVERWQGTVFGSLQSTARKSDI
jgi:hypothetical protein